MTQSLRISRSRFSNTCLCILLVANMVSAAQSNLGLRVQVVQGGGAQNAVEQIPAIPITIRASDRNDMPVRGAIVLFTAPEDGPSGDFANGLTSFTTVTDADGIAIAQRFHPNAAVGRYQIQVRVEHLGEVQVAQISQSNVARQRSIGKMVVIIAAAAAAAGATALAVGKGGDGGSNSSSPPPPTVPTITFGRSTVSGPQQ